MAKTEDERRASALAAVERLGGKLTTEDDITYQGTKFVIPERLGLPEAIQFLTQRAEDEESLVQISRTFNYRPWDGARATANAIRTAFGFTMGKTLHSFFGTQRPQFIDVKTGPGDNDSESVPWGGMTLPGVRNTTLHLRGATDSELGAVTQVIVETPRKNRFIVEGLFQLIQKNLETDSIYKGKAIDGVAQFLDTSVVNPLDVVYAEDVLAQLEANVWSRIRYANELAALGQKGKRSVLFEGPYGSGKSLAALLTAQVALENEWTFLMCRPGRDNLTEVMQMARMYQPAVVFTEDVDNLAGAQSGDISQVLDMFDGIATKGLRMLLVMTTNHADKIHKGMVRPGRLDAVIHVGGMDRPGVEVLTRRVVGTALADDVDFDKVYEAMDGYMPAFVREALDRAVGYSVSTHHGELGPIGTTELVLAASGLRDQLALMEGAKERQDEPTMDAAMRRHVEAVISGTEVIDSDGDYAFELRLSN